MNDVVTCNPVKSGKNDGRNATDFGKDSECAKLLYWLALFSFQTQVCIKYDTRYKASNQLPKPINVFLNRN